MGEMNGPVGILTGLVFLALIFGFVIYDSALTTQQALDLAVQNPLIAVPVGLLLVVVLLFGKGNAPE